jgi:hypothetical protein
LEKRPVHHRSGRTPISMKEKPTTKHRKTIKLLKTPSFSRSTKEIFQEMPNFL